MVDRPKDKPMVRLVDVNKWFGDFHVLHDLNLTVRQGERVVVCGPSSSGKSTMIRCINRMCESLHNEVARERAAKIMRSLVDEIRLHPADGELKIELVGDLAKLLNFAGDADKKKPGSTEKPGSTKWLVAGARNPRELTLRVSV